MTDAEILAQARQALQELVDDGRSEFCFDRSADDPDNAYYWEIDNPHIVRLAEILGVSIPSLKQDD